MRALREIFRSRPNKCSGCPLEHDTIWADRVLHRCGRKSGEFSVLYRLDDLGHTVCVVSLKGKIQNREV